MAAQHNKFGQVASNAIDADLYYPLFCTPSYGYQPTSHTDFLVMVYQLSAFIGILPKQHRAKKTNSRPSLSIAAIPRKVPSTLLLSPTMLSTAHGQTLCRSSQRPINSGPPFTPVRESLCARSPKNVLLCDRSPSPGFTMLIWLLRRLPSSVALLMFSGQAPSNIVLPSLTTLLI